MTAFRYLVPVALLWLAAVAHAAMPPSALPAASWVLQDAFTGQVLAQQHAGEPRAPASLAKLMTAMLVFEAVDRGELRLDERVPISERAWRATGARMFVRAGEQVPVERLAEGMAVVSANDAAIALAERVAGSVEAFVERMNARAAELGLAHTHFANPTGLDDPDQRTTAMDIARLARTLVRRYPQFAGWYARKSFEYNTIEQYNRNALLWRDPSADGIKTGQTHEAGYCLIGSASRDGMRLIATVLGAADEAARTEAAEQLLAYGFKAFETHRVLGPDKPAGQVAVRGGKSPAVGVGVAENVFVTVPRGSGGDVELQIELPSQLTAPVEAGRKIGRAVLRVPGRPDEQFALRTLEPVPEGGFWSRIAEWFGSR